MKSRYKFISFLILLSLFAFLYWLNYFISAKKNYATYFKGFDKETVSTFDLTNGIYDKELIRMDELAELCYIVYRDSLKLRQDTLRNWNRIPMKTVIDNNDVKEEKDYLYYELWKLQDIDTTIVAIVIRGTQGCSDMKANLRWVYKLFDSSTPDHYDFLIESIDAIVDSIKFNHIGNGKLKIISTGHSLGGGLAQLSAYSNTDIKYVYAFNPSPVTGFYSRQLDEERNENKKDVVIYRIYESGEGLSFIRSFMTWLYPAPYLLTKDPSIIRVRFSFSTGENLASQHAIRKFAANLAKCKIDKNFGK